MRGEDSGHSCVPDTKHPIPMTIMLLPKPGKKQAFHLQSSRAPKVPSNPPGLREKASFSLEGAGEGNLTMLASLQPALS